MQRNADGFGFRQVHLQLLPQRCQRRVGQLIFLRVKMPDIIGKRCPESDALPAALDGKIQMVCQHIGRIRVQRAVQFLAGVFGNVIRRQENFLRDVPQQIKVFFVNIIERTLHHREIGQFIGHSRKADPLAEDDHLTAFGILRQRHIIVDFFDYFHVQSVPACLL